MRSSIYDQDHEMFRGSFRAFVGSALAPCYAGWEQSGVIDRSVWVEAGKHGFLGISAPEEYGGGGSDDFRYNAIISEELWRAGITGFGIGLHNDTVEPYLTRLGTPQQLRRWLPGFCGGRLIAAIAMTEPGAGSDLRGMRTTATRRGDHYVLHGQKTFITNGVNADLVVVAAKTAGDRISLLVVERGMAGFDRGGPLKKLGQHAQDTAELFFHDVRVPVANRLGDEGAGMGYLMANLPRERMSIAVSAVAAAQRALELTLAYVKERRAFGQPVGSFQHNKFLLAEMSTEVDIARVALDRGILDLNSGALTAVDAAKLKWWTTELQNRVADRCLQLFGGYGYMAEYPIAKAFADARVQTIYGGSTEIMKEIIGRELGL